MMQHRFALGVQDPFRFAQSRLGPRQFGAMCSRSGGGATQCNVIAVCVSYMIPWPTVQALIKRSDDTFGAVTEGGWTGDLLIADCDALSPNSERFHQHDLNTKRQNS